MIKICEGWYLDAFKGNNGTEINGLVLYQWDGKFQKSKDGYMRRANCKERYYSTLDSLFDGWYKHMVNDMVDRTATLDEMFTKLQGIHDTVYSYKAWVANRIANELGSNDREAHSRPNLMELLDRLEKSFDRGSTGVRTNSDDDD